MLHLWPVLIILTKMLNKVIKPPHFLVQLKTMNEASLNKNKKWQTSKKKGSHGPMGNLRHVWEHTQNRTFHNQTMFACVIKGRVWEWNKLVLENAKICTDFAAVIFFLWKIHILSCRGLASPKSDSCSPCHLSLAALLLYLWWPFS